MRTIRTLRGRGAASATFVAIAVAAALLFAALMGGDAARVQAQTPDEDTPRYENMDSLLNEIVEQYEMGAFTASEAAASAPVNNGGSVGVIFLTEAGEADDVRDFLLESGASRVAHRQVRRSTVMSVLMSRLACWRARRSRMA